MPLITQKKYMIWIKLSFIQSCNINPTNFFKLRNFYFELVLLKGYLPYKTITPQNASSETQVKNFFTSQKSFLLLSRYSSFCIFSQPMIQQICDVIMSIKYMRRGAFLNISFEPVLIIYFSPQLFALQPDDPNNSGYFCASLSLITLKEISIQIFSGCLLCTNEAK